MCAIEDSHAKKNEKNGNSHMFQYEWNNISKTDNK